MLALLAACSSPLGFTLDVSARPDVPPLDGLRVQVTQGDLLVEQRFPLAGKPLPQSVAVLSKGMTQGTVAVVVQGLDGTRVEAIGTATAPINPLDTGVHISVVLQRLCTAPGTCGCHPVEC